MTIRSTLSPEGGPAVENTTIARGPLVEVQGLSVSLTGAQGELVPVVEDVSLSVVEGEVLGLVGESGSGKSVLSLALLRLLDSSFTVTAERLHLAGTDMPLLSEQGLDRFRGSAASMVFQDPARALDPLRSVGSLLREAQRLHATRRLSRAALRAGAIGALRKVGFPDPQSRLRARPFELSGGLRQRLMIALALVNDPQVVIADESTTALDTTIQAQIIELLAAERSGRATILITHDLDLAGTVCDTIAVMYAGRLVEVGPADRVLRSPQHPYTAGLLAAAPALGLRGSGLQSIPGAPPRLGEPRRPCAFEPRCDHSDRCLTCPTLQPHQGRLVACWHPLGEGGDRARVGT